MKRIISILIISTLFSTAYADNAELEYVYRLVRAKYVYKNQADKLDMIFINDIKHLMKEKCSDAALKENSSQSWKLWDEVRSVCSAVAADDVINIIKKGLAEFDDNLELYEPVALSGEFGGLGLVLGEKRGKVVVVDILKASPLFGSKLHEGSVVTLVDGKAVESLDGAIAMLQGKVGTSVTLTDENGNSYSANRVPIFSSYVEMNKYENDILYIRIRSFNEHTADKIKTMLDTHPDRKGVVIDISGNTGGIINEMLMTLGLFAKKVPSAGFGENDKKYIFQSCGGLKEPVAVYADEMTAAGGAMFAMLLKNEGAKLIGAETGKIRPVRTAKPILTDKPVDYKIILPIAEIFYENTKMSGSTLKPEIPAENRQEAYETTAGIFK